MVKLDGRNENERITVSPPGIWRAATIRIANRFSKSLHCRHPPVPSCPRKGGRGSLEDTEHTGGLFLASSAQRVRIASQSVGNLLWQTDGHFLCAGGKLLEMKLQFSLATILLLITSVAIESAIAFQVPAEHFALDHKTGTDVRPLTTSELLIRLVVIVPLGTLGLSGVLLIIREYRLSHVPTKRKKFLD
jgi:hypothetical protein